MKRFAPVVLVLLMAIGVHAAEEPLVPDSINQILGRINPNMGESQIESMIKRYYPDVKTATGPWSGQTGYVDFKVTARYTISIAEYNDPIDFSRRFVHADMIFFVFDWETKTRINLSFHKWDNAIKTKEENTRKALQKEP